MLSQPVISSIAMLTLFGSTCVATTPRIMASSMKNLFQRQTPSSLCPEIVPNGGSTPGVDHYNGQPGGCPYKNKMDSSGSCKNSLQMNLDDNICTGYCEVKNNWFYGKEVEINEYPSCRAFESCTYTTTNSITVEQSFSFNVGASVGRRSLESDTVEGQLDKREDAASGLKAGFDIGATYSYSTSKSTGTGLALTRPSNTMSNCGYWTFVPIFWTSCGTMTTSSIDENWYGGTEPTCGSNTQDTGNYCNTLPYQDSNGNQAGESVFVLIDCNNNELLPKASQDPIYQYPGVAHTAFPS